MPRTLGPSDLGALYTYLPTHSTFSRFVLPINEDSASTKNMRQQWEEPCLNDVEEALHAMHASIDQSSQVSVPSASHHFSPNQNLQPALSLV